MDTDNCSFFALIAVGCENFSPFPLTRFIDAGKRREVGI
jgi:hypothetical protein